MFQTRILQVSPNPITFFGTPFLRPLIDDLTRRSGSSSCNLNPTWAMWRETFRALITLSTFLQSAQVLELIREKAFRAVGVVAQLHLRFMAWWFDWRPKQYGFVFSESLAPSAAALHLPPGASLIGREESCEETPRSRFITLWALILKCQYRGARGYKVQKKNGCAVFRIRFVVGY